MSIAKSIVASAIFSCACSLPMSVFTGAPQTSGDKPVETSVCELVKHSAKFGDKIVRVHASFVSDGMDRSSLTDPHCKRGLEPFIPQEIVQHPDIKDFNTALDRGEPGTADKQVTGTFTGKFHCEPDCGAKGRRVLKISRIDDLQVVFTNAKAPWRVPH
jgi:hypothetical protein